MTTRARRHPFTLFLTVAAFTLALAGPAAAGTLDQEQTSVTTDCQYIVTIQTPAQTFTAGITGKLDQVDVWIREDLPAATVTAEIRDVAGSSPVATSLATGTIVPTGSPVTGWRTVTFATPASVVAATKYAIVLSSPSVYPNEGLAVCQSGPSNPYAAGAALFNPSFAPGQWFPLGAGVDYGFRTYVVPGPPVCEDIGPLTVPMNAATSIPLSCTDGNGETLILSTASSPSHGALTNLVSSSQTVTYTPRANYLGTDSFTYMANNGTDDSNTATVTLAVKVPITCAPGARLGSLTSGDNLVGTAGANTIDGRGGNDTIAGLAGSDCLYGSAGSDLLVGGLDADLLDGGDGVDTLDARDKSTDTALAGAGNDQVLAFDGVRDNVDCGAGTSDFAIVDTLDIVTNCERVVRTYVRPPVTMTTRSAKARRAARARHAAKHRGA